MKVLIEYEDAIATKEHTNKNLDSFHNAVGPGYKLSRTDFHKKKPVKKKKKKHFLSVLFIAQFFGTMPVCGIFSKDARHVKFHIISVRFMVSIALTLFGMIEVVTVILLAMGEDISLGIAGSLFRFLLICVIEFWFSFAQAHSYFTQCVLLEICFSSE